MRGTDWILLSYYGGENYHKHCNGTGRVTKIMIICDPDVLAGTFEILEERRSLVGSCYYMFELSSNVSCSKIPSGIKLPYGLSSGSVFCI
ncbi:Cation-dependent mannose-6-phosphate receptor, partial [Stegodyphus mimosarum]